MTDTMQRWDLAADGRRHRLEVVGAIRRTVRWYVDDELLATVETSDDNARLVPETTPGTGPFWALRLRFTSLGRLRRATLVTGETPADAKKQTLLATGGIDLEPEPGSPAARREEWIRKHPGRYAAFAAAGGVAKVLVPLVLGLLAVRFVVDLPWPSWDVPWPEITLPAIPWPQIPWPRIDLPAWHAPAWLSWVLEHVRYVWPVLVALVLAKNEIARRRKQDALRAGRGSRASGAARADEEATTVREAAEASAGEHETAKTEV